MNFLEELTPENFTLIANVYAHDENLKKAGNFFSRISND